MKTSTIVKSLNVLIIIAIIIAIGAVAVVAMTIAQSAPYVSLGQVSPNITDTVARIDIPVTIGNRGYLAFTDISARLSLKDSNGTTLVEGSGGPLTIPAGSTSTFVITITIDTAQITPELLQGLMTNSQNLTVNASLGGAIPPMVSLAASASGNFYWGAPFKSLQMGSPTFSTYNSTHLLITTPVSFDNDSPYFSISWPGSIRVVDANGQQVGSGTININAPSNTHFQGNLNIYFTIPTTLTESLLFNDSTLNYDAIVELPSFGMGGFSFSNPVSFDWNAPLNGFALGTPSISYYNSTHFKVSSLISFENHSPFISIDATVQATVYNTTSGSQVGAGSLTIHAPSGTTFSQNLIGYVELPTQYLDTLLFNDATLNYRADFGGTIQGYSFSMSKDLQVSWGAPVKDLTTGTLQAAAYNATHASVTLPFSFIDNSAFLSVQGTLTSTILLTNGAEVGTGDSYTLNVSPGATLSDDLTGYIKIEAVGQTSYILQLNFQTSYGSIIKEVTLHA